MLRVRTHADPTSRNAYVAGHLAFREAPPLLTLLERAKAKGRAPQVSRRRSCRAAPGGRAEPQD